MKNSGLLYSVFVALKDSKGGRFSLKRVFLRGFLLALFFFSLSIFSGCFYYHFVTTNEPQKEYITGRLALGKILVVHTEKNIFGWKDVYTSGDSLKGTVINDNYLPYKTSNQLTGKPFSTRYRKRLGETKILNEINLWVRSGKTLGHANEAVSLADIARCDVYEKDTVKTAMSWVFGGVAAIFGLYIVVIMLFIFAAFLGLGSSCPYVYADTGDGFRLAGEIYSGAIYAPLERNDFLTLPQLAEGNGQYHLKLSNELHEIQNTNLTELYVIDHGQGSEITIDKYGSYQVLNRAQIPEKVTNLEGTDVSELTGKRDDIAYLGMKPSEDMPLTDGIIMTFDLPAEVSAAKLFVRARNSIWLDNVYLRYHSLLGSYGDKWQKKQNRSDGEAFREWTLSQKIPLMVYIEKDGKWEFCDYFNPAGPAALKQDVLPISLKGLNPGKVRIKLESGSYFWEIDWAALDVTLNGPVDLTRISVSTAFTEKETDVADQLRYDDIKYYRQDSTGSVATLSFNSVPPKGESRTFILHSKGYYNVIEDQKGIPQVRKLKEIRQPGKFLEYSKDLLTQTWRDLYKKQ
jgi:hypothetical protein